MALQFFSPDITKVESRDEFLQFKGKSAADLKKSVGAIPSSKEITGIEIRLLPPFIIDNRTPAVFPFPGFAKLYCITIVVSDVNNQLAGGIDLQGFPRIGDKEHIPINKTIFYWQAGKTPSVAPSQIHVMTSVIKSKKSLREVGKILADLNKDTDYKNLVKGLSKLSVQTNLALEVITQLSSIVGKHLGQVEDKPLGTIVNSYTSLYGDFDQKGVQKRQYATRHVNFELEIIVRDDAPSSQPKSLTSSAKKGRAAKVEDADEEVKVELHPMK
jgi:hypothetical protein